MQTTSSDKDAVQEDQVSETGARALSNTDTFTLCSVYPFQQLYERKKVQ